MGQSDKLIHLSKGLTAKVSPKDFDRLSKFNWNYSTDSRNGKKVYLGQHKSELEAAKAFDKGSEEYHGEYGTKNFTT